MVQLDNITREFRGSRPLSELVNVNTAVDDHTFLTKGGQLLTAIRAKGVDHECLDHPQLDHVARRFESALRSLPGSFRLYQVMLKRDHAPLPSQTYEDPTIRRVIRNRVEYLESKAGALYSLDVIFVVVHETNLGKAQLTERLRSAASNPRKAVSSWLSQARTLEVVEDELARAVETLTNKVQSLLVQLQDVIGLEWLDKGRAFQQLFCHLLNYAPHKSDFASLHSDDDIGFQVGNSASNAIADHLRIDDYFAQVLTLKELPSQTHVNMLRALQELPSNFVAVLEWKREDNFDMRKAIQSRRRHYHNSKSSFTNYLNVSDQPTRPYGPAYANIPADQRDRVTKHYATVELTDGANQHGLEAIDALCKNAPAVEVAIQGLEDDSLSSDPNYNTEIGVLNKINAATVIAIRNGQDTNKLLVALAEQQVIEAKRKRDAEAEAINNHVTMMGQGKAILDQQSGDWTAQMSAFRL